LKILLGLLAALSIVALIIIGYEIRQNYVSQKRMADTFIPELNNNQNAGYNLLEELRRKDQDELGIQHL